MGMKGIFIMAIAMIGAMALIVLGPWSDRQPSSSLPAAKAPGAATVGRDFKLTSVAVDLPIDDKAFPDGPDAALVNASCTACHSASMVLTQPALSQDQWKAIVVKMRDIYHAPVQEQDIPRIVNYLSAREVTGSD